MRKQTMQKKEVVAEIVGGISVMTAGFIALWAFSIFADPGKHSLITHVPWQAILALGLMATAGAIVSELITRQPSEKATLRRLRRRNKIYYTW